jgi:NADPH:quinone reductase-like Zn-dependent oxidoreductase
VFAVQFDRFGPPEVLTIGPAPEPHAGPREIRVRVRTAGVSPVDAQLRAGTTPAAARLRLPHIPGVDAAGVVDEIGADVAQLQGLAIGAEVFGAVDVALLGGATAEFAVLRFWTGKPAVMTWAEAGGSGTSIETATRALDLLDLGEGMTLLIDGAAGGVGSATVQLAAARGVRVIGTTRPANHDFLRGLGATPIDSGPGLYERLAAAEVGSIDRVLDVAGAGSLPELIALTGAASSVLTIADFGGPKLGVRLSMGALAGEPGGEHGLGLAAGLAEQGRFRMPVERVFPVTAAKDAHNALTGGSRRGKFVLAVAP